MVLLREMCVVCRAQVVVNGTLKGGVQTFCIMTVNVCKHSLRRQVKEGLSNDSHCYIVVASKYVYFTRGPSASKEKANEPAILDIMSKRAT
jgi:hypothetical protein